MTGNVHLTRRITQFWNLFAFIHSGCFLVFTFPQVRFVVIYFRSDVRRHCATSWNVAGFILDGLIGIFRFFNPSGRHMALSSTNRLKDLTTRDLL
jgi:hypothetical protein